MYRASRPPDPTPTPNPMVSAAATPFEAARQVIAIGDMEYCLGKDGDVLHRMTRTVTFLDAHNPFNLADEEKSALEMLKAKPPHYTNRPNS